MRTIGICLSFFLLIPAITSINTQKYVSGLLSNKQFKIPGHVARSNGNLKDVKGQYDTATLRQSDWYKTITHDLQMREYHFRMDTVHGIVRAPNRSQQMTGNYSPGNLILQSGSNASANWQFKLSLEGIFADGKKVYAPQKDADTDIQQNVLAFQHGDTFKEEYINNEEGVRQNFIILKEPAGQQKNISVRLHTPAKWKMNKRSDQEIQFSLKSTKDPDVLITYNSLRVWDARQKELPANFTIDGNSLSIDVETAGAAYPITIDPLSTVSSWSIESNQASANCGYALCSAGDVNGDGYSDVLVSSYQYDNGLIDRSGMVTVYMGLPGGLSALAARTYYGTQAQEFLGMAISTAGDVNGDGYSDIILGSPGYSGTAAQQGKASIYYGSATGLPASPNVVLLGEISGAEFGDGVACAGDVNGDGYSDLLVGAPGNTSFLLYDGKVYLYAGSASGLNTTAVWTDTGEQASSVFGSAIPGLGGNGVASAGDVNGDGYDDVLVGAPYFDTAAFNAGKVYLYLGSPTWLSVNPVWSYASDQTYSRLGNSMASAGDVNGDGYGDVIVGQGNYGITFAGQGRVLVFYGSASGLALVPDLIITTTQNNAQFGSMVSSAGDVNGDGFADVIIGSVNYNSGMGGAYVFLGAKTGLSPGTSWQVFGPQAGCAFGSSVACAGDVNGDGYSDVIVGADNYDNPEIDEGKTFLYLGSPNALTITPALTLESNQLSSNFGFSVASAGDVNADGYSDVIVGAYWYDNPESDEGVAFIYHGSANGISTTPSAILESNQVNAKFGYAVASAGDLNGDGYSDVVVGADHYTSNAVSELSEGALFIFLGSATGINTVPVNILESNQPSGQLGHSCSSAGDVNGDGYSDIIGGAIGYSNGQLSEGAALLWMGSSGGVTNTTPVILDNNISAGFMGSSVAAAGDLNGDGYGDIAVSAELVSNPESYEGAVYVYYGSGAGINTIPSVTLEMNEAGAQFGKSIAAAGDVNGDGYGDLIVGSIFYDYVDVNDGAAFIFNGSSTGISTTPTSTLGFGDPGIYYGCSVSSAGDVNGDGYSDVIVGAMNYTAGETNEGFAAVYLGRPVGINLASTVIFQSNQANANLGYSVACLGDVNGDGYSDIAAGIPFYDNPTLNEGACFVYYGNYSNYMRGNLRLYNADLVTPIQQANMYDPNLFGVGLYAKSFTGRTKAKLVWQTVKNGQPFTGYPITISVAFTAQQATYVMLGLTGTELKNAVAKQVPTKATYVRARVKYDPAKAITGQIYGPWRYPDGFMRGRRDVGSVALPLQIIAFTAVKEGEAASLTWKTTQEEPGIQFAVERGTDGIHFTQLSIINGLGNAENNYTWKDISPAKGKNYYRIKAIETNKTTYTSIRMLDFSGIADMQVSPNPVKAGSSIQITNLPVAGNSIFNISLINMNGQVILRKENLAAANGIIALKLTDVPAGNYLLQVTGGRWQEVRKIILE